MSDIKDLISNAIDQKPSTFADSFNDIILDKIKTAVDNKKVELAQSIFDKPSDEEEEFIDANEFEEPEVETPEEEESNG